MIVLDTNVISELMRGASSPAVVHWMNARVATSLFITSITQAEIMYGIGLPAKGKRRDGITSAAERVFERGFAGRILPFGSGAAIFYAQIAVARRRAGRPISTLDAQIAAIARANGAVLATRNVDDFDGCGLEVIDPWT